MKVYPQNVILSVRDNIVYREEERHSEKKFVEFVMKKMRQKVNY